MSQKSLRKPSNKQPQTINHVMVGKRMQVKHNNSYDLLFSEPECYIYHNYGHKAADFRLYNYKQDLTPIVGNFKVWKRKKMTNVD